MPREAGLLAGAAALAGLFLISWPLMVAGIALALQLQTSRVFWMLDLLAAIYIAWLLARSVPIHGCTRARSSRCVVAIAVGRGVFVWRVGARRRSRRTRRLSAG